MKRFIAFVALLVTAAFIGNANAQISAGAVSIEDISNSFNADSLIAGQNHNIRFRVNNNTTCRFNYGNGFRVFSTDGAVFGQLVGDTLGDRDGNAGNGRQAFLGAQAFPLIAGFNRFSNDGLLADTLNFFGSVSGAANPGLAAGFNEVALSIQFSSRIQDSGKHICIDSSFSFPGGRWIWAQVCAVVGQPTPPNAIPTWSGQRCWTIYAVPDLAPAITNCPASVTNSHCNTFTYDFNAADPDTTGGAITFEQLAGPGTTDANSGVWSWAGADETNVGTSISLIVRAKNALNSAPCTVDVIVTNAAPVLTAGCGANPSVSTGGNASIDFNHTDDCGVATYSATATTAGVTGAFSINPATGVLSYSPSSGDAALSPICFEVVVTDAAGAADTCSACYNVVVGSKYKIQIEKVKDAFQNQFACVDILLKGIDATEGLGGFDLLIAYDNSAMSLNSAAPGTIYDECGWEYFTFRYGASGNCGGGCPSGLVRVVGLAETNNGANHPACDVPAVISDSLSLATLCFLVSNDRTLECQYVPVRFYWIDCGDNSLSNEDGSKLIISKDVFDFTAYGDPYVPGTSIDNLAASLPTYLGAPGVCDVQTPKGFPIRDLDLQNGGVDIICADSIDGRGDINLNGIYEIEIADVVMFTQYFVEGLSAFGTHVQGSIAASDVNADGIPLSVADLVYAIRVIVGDAAQYDKASSELTSASYAVNNGILSVNAEMGGAFVVLAGNVTPEILANNMMSTVAFDGTNTRVLLTSTYAPLSGVTESFEGSFLNIGNSEIVSIELASTEGTVVASKLIPNAYSLDQNYPNPFNPKTTIRFGLPTAGAYTLTFYNVTGQVVNEVSEVSEAGIVTYDWDASNLASGVYFYKVVTADGQFSATKKAVLLK